MRVLLKVMKDELMLLLAKKTDSLSQRKKLLGTADMNHMYEVGPGL